MAINVIIKRRKELKLTQEEVSVAIGLSRKQYNNLEKNGKGKIETLFKVLVKLNLKLQVLRNEDDNVLDFNSLPKQPREIKDTNVYLETPLKLTWRDKFITIL